MLFLKRKTEIVFVAFCLTLILGLATNCSSNQKLLSVSKVISESKTNEIKVIPLDDLYINWLNSTVKKNKHWDWSLRINDKGNIKEYYSDLIYFTGALDASGNKTGIWEAYYRSKLIIKTSYPGSTNNNAPMYVKLWDPAGKLIKEMNFSIINQ